MKKHIIAFLMLSNFIFLLQCTADYNSILERNNIPLYPESKVTAAKLRIEIYNSTICNVTIRKGWGKYDSSRAVNVFFIKPNATMEKVKEFYVKNYPKAEIETEKGSINPFDTFSKSTTYYTLKASDTLTFYIGHFIFPEMVVVILKDRGKLYPKITLKNGSNTYNIITHYHWKWLIVNWFLIYNIID